MWNRTDVEYPHRLSAKLPTEPRLPSPSPMSGEAKRPLKAACLSASRSSVKAGAGWVSGTRIGRSGCLDNVAGVAGDAAAYEMPGGMGGNAAVAERGMLSDPCSRAAEEILAVGVDTVPPSSSLPS